MEDEPEKIRIKWADVVIAAIFLACIVVSLHSAGFFGGSSAGEKSTVRARITVCGSEYVYPLSENRTLSFVGEQGPAILLIEDGSIRFESSVCNDYTCIHMGKAGPHAARFIACLPNQITVTIEGDAPDEAELDW